MDDQEPTQLPIDGTLDLHAFHPRDAKSLVIDYIDACTEEGIYELRIVHGKGTGALRETVHAVLRKSDRVERFRLGAEDTGNWGATLVWLKRSV